MSRRRGNNTIEITLFPFLSILACVIGTLTLMIAGLTAGQVQESTTQEDLSVEQMIAEMLAVQRLLNINVGHPNPEVRLRELEQENRRLPQQIEALRSLVPDEATPTPIQLQAEGNVKNPEVLFVDCTEHSLIIHPSLSHSSTMDLSQPFSRYLDKVIINRESARIRKADIDTSQRLQRYFEEISARPGGYVVFLVRPDGIESFRQTQAIANKMEIPYNYVPILVHSPVDFADMN